MHLYVRFCELNKENIQETLVNYRCQKTFHLKGLVGKLNICAAMDIVDLIHATNPITNVLRCEVESS